MNKITTILILLRGFVRCNFIGFHRWNGRESTNQLRQHISDMEYVHLFLVLSFGVEDGPKNWSRKDRLTALESQTMTFKLFNVDTKLSVVTKVKFWRLFRPAFL